MFAWFRRYIRKIGIFGVEVEFHPPEQTVTDKPTPLSASHTTQPAVRESPAEAKRPAPGSKPEATGVSEQTSATASTSTAPDSVQELVKRFGFPRQQMAIPFGVSYYVYEACMAKVT